MISEKERLVQALETISKEKKELLNSKEYRLGNNIVKTIEYIKKFQFDKIKKKIIDKHRKKIDKRKLCTVKNEEQEIITNNKSIEDKKIVVYTCITGNYDEAVEPLYYNNNVDYVIYTNCTNIKLKEWQKRDIPENIQKINDNVLINRYAKMHPKELFEDYDYAIYIDGNIRTISDVSSFINSINEKTGLAIHKHYARNSIYQEAEACKLYKKGSIDKLDRQIQKYKEEGFPDEYGLLECNVIVSDLKNQNATTILNKWWDEFLASESRRDQISLPYSLWKLNFKIEDVGCLGNNVRENCKIEVIKHS